jgi:SAM-dependent methyltransferase
MTVDPTTEQFFERKYRCNPDPWNFVTSDYERNRYAVIMRALADRSYTRALEPGCSIGVLTARLASICDQVEALDISPTAIQLARARCRNSPNITFTRASIAQFIPAGSFDLIVFSEIGYYFDEKPLASIEAQLAAQLAPGGTFLAAHWRGVSQDHVLGGQRVHEILDNLDDLIHRHRESRPNFLLEMWERR